MHSQPHRSLLWAVGASLSLAAPAAAQPAPPAEPPARTAPQTQGSPALELRDPPERLLTGTNALTPQAGGLTADRVAARALVANPTLEARQAEIAAARAKLNETVAQFLPQLTLTAMYRRVSRVDSGLGGAIVGAGNEGPIGLGPCPDPAMGSQCPTDAAGQPLMAVNLEFPTIVNQYSLNAQLSVPLSDYVLRLASSLDASRGNARASRIRKRAESLKVAADARVAYYDWLRAVAAGAVAQSSLERFRALAKDAQTALELGTATKADVLRVEAAVASTELAITETEAMRSLLEEQLATLMGESVRRYRVGETVAVDPTRIPRPERLDALVAEAHRQRLELRALAAAAQSLRDAGAAVRVSQYPRLDAFADLTYANPNHQVFPQSQEWNATWAVGLALSWRVNEVFSSSSQAAELDASRAKLEANRRSLQRGVRLEVTAAYHDVRKARVAIETAARGSAAAREAYRVARDLYQVGGATTTDLIQAESELVGASLNEVNAALDYRVAGIKLAHATGRDTPNAS